MIFNRAWCYLLLWFNTKTHATGCRAEMPLFTATRVNRSKLYLPHITIDIRSRKGQKKSRPAAHQWYCWEQDLRQDVGSCALDPADQWACQTSVGWVYDHNTSGITAMKTAAYWAVMKSRAGPVLYRISEKSGDKSANETARKLKLSSVTEYS